MVNSLVTRSSVGGQVLLSRSVAEEYTGPAGVSAS